LENSVPDLAVSPNFMEHTERNVFVPHLSSYSLEDMFLKQLVAVKTFKDLIFFYL